MVRTQIYLSDDTHATLLELARAGNTSLSALIRQGAAQVIKKQKKINKYTSPQQKALNYFANYPDSKRIKLSDSAVNLVRKERD